MDVVFTAHGAAGSESVLSQHVIDWIQQTSISRCVLLVPRDEEYQLIEEELNNSLSVACSVERVVLPKMQTKNIQTPTDLKSQPWAILNHIQKCMNLNNETTVFLGRGSRLHDHLLWLSAQCHPNAHLLHIDSLQPALSIKRAGSTTDIATSTLRGLLHFHLQDIENKRPEHLGYSDAERLSGYAGAGTTLGVRPALQTFVEKNLVEKLPVAKTSVSYKLTPAGFADAFASYCDRRFSENDTIQRNLNIVFGRLPHIQTENPKGEKQDFNLFQYIAPLQPIDGLLVVLQRHSDEIEGTHVVTLEDALVQFEHSDAHFIGDLRNAHRVLVRRSQEDLIDMKRHLVVINPKATQEFHLEFLLHLLNECRTFEENFGLSRWNIDLTQPLGKLHSAVSFFTLLSGAITTYIYKNQLPNEEQSPFTRKEHLIPVPNKMAYETLNAFKNPHGNTKDAPNLLQILLLWERHQEEQNAGIEGDLFVAPKSTTAQQQTANNANLSEFYERELKPKYNEIFYPTNFNRIIKKLNAHGLVVKQGMAYSLTDLGTFVAEQLLKITEMEALN
jgi:hypothetical protein